MWALSRHGAMPMVALALFALWPSASVADKTAADYYVHDLPGVPKDSTPIKMHAG